MLHHVLSSVFAHAQVQGTLGGALQAIDALHQLLLSYGQFKSYNRHYQHSQPQNRLLARHHRRPKV